MLNGAILTLHLLLHVELIKEGKEMVRKLSCAVLLFAIAAGITFGITQRPPIPADIPFPYDSNLVTAEILEWFIAEPNLSFIYSPAVKNKWGLEVDFIVVDCYDSNTPILVERGTREKDPDGGWIQRFQVIATLSKEGVHYLEMTAVDKKGRTDVRILLVLCAADDPPFIFMEDPPVITDAQLKNAQKTWQYAKKMQYSATNPTHVK